MQQVLGEGPRVFHYYLRCWVTMEALSPHGEAHTEPPATNDGTRRVRACSVASDSLWPQPFVAHAASLACVLSRIWLFVTSTICSPRGFSVHGILQATYCSGLPCPPPGDLPYPGIQPAPPARAPAAAGGFLTTEPPGKPLDRTGGQNFLSHPPAQAGPFHLTALGPQSWKGQKSRTLIGSSFWNPLCLLQFNLLRNWVLLQGLLCLSDCPCFTVFSSGVLVIEQYKWQKFSSSPGNMKTPEREKSSELRPQHAVKDQCVSHPGTAPRRLCPKKVVHKLHLWVTGHPPTDEFIPNKAQSECFGPVLEAETYFLPSNFQCDTLKLVSDLSLNSFPAVGLDSPKDQFLLPAYDHLTFLGGKCHLLLQREKEDLKAYF